MKDTRSLIEALGSFTALVLLAPIAASASTPTCGRTINAHVVALDQVLTVDRMGATMPGGMIFALAVDVFPKGVAQISANSCLAQPATCTAGNVVLRDDKRPRPVVLRANEGDCLAVTFTNLLNPTAGCYDSTGKPTSCSDPDLGQPTTRITSVHVQGMPWVDGPQDDGSWVGKNTSSLAYLSPPELSGPLTYRLYAEHEGSYLLYSAGDSWQKTTSGDGGQLTEGLFGAVNIQPADKYPKPWGAQWYRSQVTEQDLCLATPITDHVFAGGECTRKNPDALPVIDYNAVYPAGHPRAGLPILDMLCSDAVIKAGATCTKNELIHSDLTAIVTGPSNAKGQPQGFPDGPSNTLPPSLRPIYAYADRLQPYREFTIIYHESFQVAQAFPTQFTQAPVLNAAADNFGINYGMEGLSAPVLANRFGVGPQGGCTDCKFEEFFLSSWALGDPALVVDNPPTTCVDAGGKVKPGCKSTVAYFPDDPSNVYHTYMGDHVRFRILHGGSDLHHLHHQHAHQWLATPNAPNSDYLDSQSIGPGSSFTLEMVYYGSGNVNQTVGDSIFHCHFYPHFASGMWSLWRVHDVFEGGTILKDGKPVDRKNPTTGKVEYTRALPDGEIASGTPIPGLVPITTLPMAPMPAAVRLQSSCKNDPTRNCFADADCPGSVCQEEDRGTRYCVMENVGTPQETCISATQPAAPFDPKTGPASWDWRQIKSDVAKLRNPGYPFFVPGIGGSRAPHPPLDFAFACSKSGKICTPFDRQQGQSLRRALGAALQMPKSKEATAAVESQVEALRLLSPLAEEGQCDAVEDGVCEPLDGGLPRSVAAIGSTADSWTPTPVVNNSDYSKVLEKLTAVALPETGTLVERVAMATHALRFHDTQLPDGQTKGICSDNKAPCTPTDLTQCANPGKATCDLTGNINFVLNGLPPAQGAPYADPCVRFDRLGRRPKDLLTRDYLAADLQLDAVFNKEGWHFPQQRMISLWGDVFDFLDRKKPPEPLFMRVNSNDCMSYVLANLVPNVYELDDFEVRTPTDILGQHIHLVKFDVTSSDGAGNGWNYEDGTFAPNEVTERINAINAVKGLYVPAPSGPPTQVKLASKTIKFFGPGPNQAWVGAQATVQRWYDDPLYNNFGVCKGNLDQKCTLSDQEKTCSAQGGFEASVCDVSAGHCSDNGKVCTASNLTRCADPLFANCNPSQDRTIRTVFTHDHFGPSTHQQAGLYAGVVAEPKNSTWFHNETGEPFGGFNPATNKNFPGRKADHNGVSVNDGGPTSWQAIIQVPPNAGKENPSFREFLLEVQDSTLTYQPFAVGSLEGGPLGNCGKSPDEPCGFCAYDGVCVTTATLQPASPVTPCVIGGSGTSPCASGTQQCLLNLDHLRRCTPDLESDASYTKVCSGEAAGVIPSCDFVPGVPSTSWTAATSASKPPAAGTPIDAGNGAGPGGQEAITFNNATNSFSYNYRNEPLYGRTTDPASGYPLAGPFGDLAFAYSSLGFCAGNTTQTCTGDADCGGAVGSCTGRPSPRAMACSGSLGISCTTSCPSGAGTCLPTGFCSNSPGTSCTSSCPSGTGTCQPTGFCSDNYSLCTAGTPGNVSLCGDPTATCLADATSFPYPRLTSGIEAGDPFTPLLRTYAGDDLHIRTLIGAHINPHNFTLHGMNWLKESSYVDSGWRNSMVMGISEHFESVVRVPPPFELPAGAKETQPWADFMYQPGLAAIEQAGGNWGLLRAYDSFHHDLAPLPQNQPPKAGSYPSVAACPAKATQRSYDVVALTAVQALGTSLVYNKRLGFSDGQAILYFSPDDPKLKCSKAGDSYDWSTCHYQGEAEPLVLRAAAGDCITVTLYNGLPGPQDIACSDETGNTNTYNCTGKYVGQQCGQNNVGTCGLYPGKDGQPGGANGQGTCSTAPAKACTPYQSSRCPADICSSTTSANGTCSISGATCNINNLCKPAQCATPIRSGVPSQQLAYQQSATSLQVGLRPQLVTYDPRFDDGTNSGFNAVQTAAPGGKVSYTWFAGNIDPLAPETGRYIPIEFGAANLLPADPLNHYLAGLFAGLIIEPAGSTWKPSVGTTAEVTYTPQTGGGGPVVKRTFKELVIFMQDDSNNMNFPTQSTDNVQINAVNYKSEPLKNRQQPSPRLCQACPSLEWACMFAETPFIGSPGNNCTTSSFAPETPTFTAQVGQEVRFRLLHGGGTNTDNVFELYGHNFSEAPYMTLPPNCVPAPITLTRLTASQFIGQENLCGSRDFYYDYQNYTGSLWRESLNEWKGSLMGHGPGNHYDVVVTSAGGPLLRCGDYLYRSYPADHGGLGIWGIFRVGGCANSSVDDAAQPEVPAGK